MTDRRHSHFDQDTWRLIMASAPRVVDSLRHNGYGKLEFRLGGGTVLMFRFDHRVSKHIDIFTYDAQALSFSSPRLNKVAARGSLTYEDQANTLKLELPDGDVNFIVAAPAIPGRSARRSVSAAERLPWTRPRKFWPRSSCTEQTASRPATSSTCRLQVVGQFQERDWRVRNINLVLHSSKIARPAAAIAFSHIDAAPPTRHRRENTGG